MNINDVYMDLWVFSLTDKTTLLRRWMARDCKSHTGFPPCDLNGVTKECCANLLRASYIRNCAQPLTPLPQTAVSSVWTWYQVPWIVYRDIQTSLRSSDKWKVIEDIGRVVLQHSALTCSCCRLFRWSFCRTILARCPTHVCIPETILGRAHV